MSVMNETRLQIRESVRDFTEKEVIPIAAELDRKEENIPESLIRKMGEMGYYGVLVPEEFGGSGIGHVELCIITEELCRGWLSVGSLIHRNIATLNALMKPGNEALRDKFMPRLLTGEYQSAAAGTEPEAGSDAANIKTMAVKSGNEWVINGQKMFCTHAQRANLLQVLTRTEPLEPGQKKHRGLTQFLVEKEPGMGFNPPQLVGTKIPTVGYHGMGTFELAFQDCTTPEEHRLSPLGRGFHLMMENYESFRITFAARAVGVAQAAFEAALKYAPMRVQFDQPISRFQGIRFKLADMGTAIDHARQYTFYAAEKKDAGIRCDLEAGMAKLFATEMAQKVTWEAIQIHGGYGYTKELPLERYWRDAGLFPIGEGTSEVQREIIARRLLERVGAE